MALIIPNNLDTDVIGFSYVRMSLRITRKSKSLMLMTFNKIKQNIFEHDSENDMRHYKKK